MPKKASKLKGYNNVFATRLRELMEVRDITQDVLAEKANCTRQSISQYMDGSSIPNVDKLLSIAEYFRVSIDYLLGLATEPTTDKDINFICEYTGLDEFSVRELHRLQRKKELVKKEENNTLFSDIRKSNAQNAEIDIEFLNVFLSSPFNSVFNHRDSYLYEYCRNLDKCIDLYNQVINFEIKEHYDSAYLFQQWNKFDDEIQETRKKIRVDRYLITDDFIDTLEFFVHDKLGEIKEKEELSREKLGLMYEIIVKSGGSNNANNP